MIKVKPIFLLFLALLTPVFSHGVESPFAIDLRELERPGSATAAKAERDKGRSEQRSRKRSDRTSHKQREKRGSDGYLRHTVQPGDHLFKILTGRFGMSNEAAEKLIPGIVRINRIRDIKNLTVGETLLIPNREQRAAVAAKEDGVKVPAAAPASESGGKATPARGSAEVAPSPSPLPPPAFAGRSATTRSPAGGEGANEHRLSGARITAKDMPAPAPPAKPQPATAATHPTPATHPMPATATATPPTASETRPSPVVASAASPATTWICPVPERDPAAAIDALLSLLEASVSREKTVKAGQGGDNSFAVEVDRYFEYKGGRYIVSLGDGDANRYTLLRILEMAGYKVLRLDDREDFRSAGEKLMRLVGVEPDFGRHALQPGKGISGFLIKQDGTMGRRVVVSAEQLGAGERWVLAPECGAR